MQKAQDERRVAFEARWLDCGIFKSHLEKISGNANLFFVPRRPAKTYDDRMARPPLERMMHIPNATHAGKFPNATTLAKDLEVSVRSISRDIEFIS